MRRYWDEHSTDHVDRACPLDSIGISTAWIMLIEPVPLKVWDQHSKDYSDRVCLLEGIGTGTAQIM